MKISKNMKTSHKLLVSLIIGLSLTSRAQLVPNGSFENGSRPTDPAQSGSTLSTNTALPGWSIFGSPLYYQYGPLGGPVIAIGNYYAPSSGTNAIYLQAGFSGAPTPVSLWQNLVIPSNIKSITFESKSAVDPNLYHGYYLALLFSTAGVSITPQSFSTNSAGYINYGIDVSAYAGSTMELRFTVDPLGGPVGGAYLIDNIQFSQSPVPEPFSWTLFGIGGGILGFRFFRKK